VNSFAQVQARPYNFAVAQKLEKELGISHVVSQVLTRRGYDTVDKARRFLNADTQYSFEEFVGIKEAVKLIEHHAQLGSQVTIHGDYDVDGVSATALLVRAFHQYGLKVDTFIPSRVEDGYGLSIKTVERLANRGTNLLITVDCGITSVEEVQRASELDIDVIITDHHLPRSDGKLPAAVTVHPAVSKYAFEDLCGCAVAYKVAKALEFKSEKDLKVDRDLDLVALATVADSVPLIDENRTLVRQGLMRLAVTDKPGLNALLNRAKVDREAINSETVSFGIAPKLNAAGRLYHADAALELLLTEDDERAEEITDELYRVNMERRDVERQIVAEAEKQIKTLTTTGSSVNVVVGEGWNPGVIGIVAARLVDSTGRPTVVVAQDGKIGKGSCRSLPGVDIVAALDSCSQYLSRYGGHSAAAGLELEIANIESFVESLDKAVQPVLDSLSSEAAVLVDAVVAGEDLTLDVAEELEMLGPFGNSNPSPLIYIPGSKIENTEKIGDGQHVRFSVVSGSSRVQAVAFKTGGSLPGGLVEGERFNAAWNLSINRWRGSSYPQLQLKTIDTSPVQPIDVLDDRLSYFDRFCLELDRDSSSLKVSTAGSSPVAYKWQLRDVRYRSIFSTLGDVSASSNSTIVVCSDPSIRAQELSQSVGGFALCSYDYLEFYPDTLSSYSNVVLLDPPMLPLHDEIVKTAECEYVHLAWGSSEVNFAQRYNTLSYDLNDQLKYFYRAFKGASSVVGQVELESLMRGSSTSRRSPYIAGRLLRVLVELDLFNFDREACKVLVESDSEKRNLEHSAAYVAYRERHSSGQLYLDKLVKK